MKDKLGFTELPQLTLRPLTIKQMKFVKGGEDTDEQTEDNKRRQRPGGGVSTQSPPRWVFAI